MAASEQWVLQFCHGYDGPFLDCARQYAVLFAGTSYKVCTVYLTGEPNEAVRLGSASDEVVFLGYGSKAVRGLKLGAIRDIKRIVAGRDFAFCIAHRSKPSYVALIGTRLPVIGVHHAFGDFARRSRRTFANLFRKRLMLLGVSDAVRDDIRHCFPNWPPKRIQTLYNRIDIDAVQAEQVSREEARDFLGIPHDAWVVGNVGRLHPDKDQATLISAFSRALPNLPPGAMLAIMGEGRLEQALRAQVADMGIETAVRFLGQVERGRRYFKAFNVFALTSDHEPFGMVLLEAMVAGLPVIASDCGGAREVVDDAGMLFPLRDIESLAGIMSSIATRSDTAKCRMVRLQQARVLKHFTDDTVRERFWSIFEDLNKDWLALR